MTALAVLAAVAAGVLAVWRLARGLRGGPARRRAEAREAETARRFFATIAADLAPTGLPATRVAGRLLADGVNRPLYGDTPPGGRHG